MKTIGIRYNKTWERWVLVNPVTGSNMFELPDCQNFRDVFPDANKEALNIYEVKTTKKGERNGQA